MDLVSEQTTLETQFKFLTHAIKKLQRPLYTTRTKITLYHDPQQSNPSAKIVTLIHAEKLLEA